MATQAGFNPNVFGPFGALFQNYLSALENFSEGRSPFGDLPGFDTHAVTSQMTAPFKAAARCQLAVLGLTNRRAQAYLQVPTRLAQCRTPQDLLNEQTTFIRTAVEQYAECSQKIGESVALFVPALAGSGRTERDYISFNNGSGKDHSSSSQKPDTGAKQRRVA